jgi:hypothetical protein
VDDYRVAYRALAVGIDRWHWWESDPYIASYRRNRTHLSAYCRSQGRGLTPFVAVGLWTRLSPQEEIMRLWDSVLIKILAVISLIALASVAQAVIQGH